MKVIPKTAEIFLSTSTDLDVWESPTPFDFH